MHIDGVELAIDDRGSGPPALLIHGTAAGMWGELPDALAETRRVIAYDRRGFGASGGAPIADLRRHARDAAAVLRALNATPAVVVGWSIGGVIALDLALAVPDLVSGLVLVEPPLHAKRHPRPAMIKAILGAKLANRRRGGAAGGERFLRWALGDGFDAMPPAWREAMAANGDAIVRELDGGTGEHLTRGALRRVAQPACWLVGDRSDAAFRRAGARAAALMPDCELRVVEGSGHLMQRDRPDAIVRAVAELRRKEAVGA